MASTSRKRKTRPTLPCELRELEVGTIARTEDGRVVKLTAHIARESHVIVRPIDPETGEVGEIEFWPSWRRVDKIMRDQSHYLVHEKAGAGDEVDPVRGDE